MSSAPRPTPFVPDHLARLLAYLAALALVVACGSPPERPHVVIVVIDTLRADRVGVERGGQSLTPFLDSLADRAVVYRNAYAPSPWTNPSVASLWTSRFPSQHGIVWFDTVLSESEETLAEILREHGYTTAGFVANPLLRAKHGFDQGFDVLRTLGAQKGADGKAEIYASAEKVNEAALSWLDGLGGMGGDVPPFFLYVHYMEPHYPFDPAPDDLDRVLGGRPRPALGRINEALQNQDSAPIDEGLLQSVLDAYDAEVMGVDARLESLFLSLEERHVLSRAIVVVTADHGEELLEHGYIGHHQALYEESIRVPLLILAPEMEGPAETTTDVSLLDVAPTVLDLAGIARPESFEGRSLRPGASPGGTSYVVSELLRVKIVRYKSPHERAVMGAGRKLILGVGGRREFYDLSRDPLETDPEALGDADRAELVSRADQVRALALERPAAPTSRELDPETLEQLRALGYER
jgi:arylsulfatase A-like enzyme